MPPPTFNPKFFPSFFKGWGPVNKKNPLKTRWGKKKKKKKLCRRFYWEKSKKEKKAPKRAPPLLLKKTTLPQQPRSRPPPGGWRAVLIVLNFVLGGVFIKPLTHTFYFPPKEDNPQKKPS